MKKSLLPQNGDSFGVINLTVVAAVMLAGCSGKTSSESNPVSSSNPTATNSLLGGKSTAEFLHLLKPGMSTNEFLAVLGRPDHVDETLGYPIWSYALKPFPADDNMRGSWVIGVSISATNGKLAHLDFTYAGSETKNLSAASVQPVGSDRDEQPPKLQFFLIKDSQVDGGQFIDTAKFSKLGYIGPAPDLGIGRLKRITVNEQLVTDSENNQRTNWSIDLTLPDECVPQLKAMTETNIFKKVLITLGDEPILAPMIMAPIESGNLAITVDDRSSMENLKRRVERMSQAER